MDWVWDEAKERINRQKHGFGFGLARCVFDDPLALSLPDPHPDGDRWRTIGMVATQILFVVHSWPEETENGAVVGRIISARKATAHERRSYEENRF